MSLFSSLIIFINNILELKILDIELLYILITILSINIVFGIIYAIGNIRKK
jgi:hypothetical protein